MDVSALRNHKFLASRNKGPCRRLRGKVLLEVVYVEDVNSTWTQAEKDQFYAVFRKAMENLLIQAMEERVDLSISAITGDFRYKGDVSAANVFSDVTSRIYMDYLRTQGFYTVDSFVRSRKITYQFDEIAVMLVFDEQFRAHALSGETMEFCVLGKNNDIHAIGHELLHLFGAADLYYPYHIYGLTMEYFPKSIMCTYEGMEVDPLTQFLVGWREDMEAKTLEFMNKISDHTHTRGRKAQILEIYRDREEELSRELTPFSSMNDLIRYAEEEDPWAEYLLGLCMRDGIGMEKMPARAEILLRRSSRTGLTIASAAYAQMILCRGAKRERDKEELRLLVQYNSYYNLKLNAIMVACRYYGVIFLKNQQAAVQSAQRMNDKKWPHRDFPKRSAKQYRIAEGLSSRIPELHAVVSKLRSDYERMLAEGDPDLQYFIARQKEAGTYVAKDIRGAYSLYTQAGSLGNCLAWEALAEGEAKGYWHSTDPNYRWYCTAMSSKERRENPWDGFCRLIEEQENLT